MESKGIPSVPPLRMIAWEVTRNCNLSCVHCRASAEMGPYHNELPLEKCIQVIDDITSFSAPVIILTGGEPLLREDIFEIAEYGNRRGLRMVMAINGTLLTPEKAEQIRKAGIRRVSISIDGATSTSHDDFRQVEGAFSRAMKGLEYLKKAGIEFQINTTITKRNLHELPEIYKLAVSLGAVAHHIFVLVPVGRGKELEEKQPISPEEYDKVLHWFWEQEKETPLQLKATCAPQYYRIRQEEGGKNLGTNADSPSGFDAKTRGCLGGVSFCFISHLGTVAPCGYLELDCGSIRENSLKSIWTDSPIFRSLRDFKGYEGKCGSCKFVKVCGGCRARAYYGTGSYLNEDPLCSYQPHGAR